MSVCEVLFLLQLKWIRVIKRIVFKLLCSLSIYCKQYFVSDIINSELKPKRLRLSVYVCRDYRVSVLCLHQLRSECGSHKIDIWVLWLQPLVPFIYNRPTPMTDIVAVQSRKRSGFVEQLRCSVGGTWLTFPHVSSSSHGLTCLLSSKMEFLLGNPYSTPVGHCIGM